MTQKDFWHNAKIGVIGGGSWGTVLANLAARNCQEVRVWMRDEESVRTLNSTRVNSRYFPELQLHDRLHAYPSREKIFEGGVHCLLWVLPSDVSRQEAKAIAPLLKGDEIPLHATKGIEPGSMKRVSEVLAEELPIRKIGVISGPNLAQEIAQGNPGATVIASAFSEVREAGQVLLSNERFQTQVEKDVIGVEWAGALKNILAIAAGALDAMKLGWNTRAMFMTAGLKEVIRFSVAMGAHESTFLGLAGIGDLIATCFSPLSRNYRVGFKLAQGELLSKILEELGTTAEGVRTTESVWEYACQHRIAMPITEQVFLLMRNQITAEDVVKSLTR